MKEQRQFSSRWFRFYDEVVDDPKVQTLSDKQFRFWVSIMCMASQNGGLLPAIPAISWKLRKSESVVAALIAELYERNLLDQEATSFSPHNWSGRQYLSDVSTQRVRDHRERKRNVSRNGEETKEPLHETPSETEADTDTEEPPNPRTADAALDRIPTANRSVVRSAVPARSRRGKRTTEEIQKALGQERLSWWENFWRAFPCHDGMKEGMDAFERRVTTREIAVLAYKGAQRYAALFAAQPDMKLKYAQGWINNERWEDECAMPRPPTNGAPSTETLAEAIEAFGRTR